MSIEKQLELEQRMIDAGVEHYKQAQREAEAMGRGHELDYSRRLMQEFMLPLIDALNGWLALGGARKHGRARGLLKQIDSEKAMYIAMRALFSSFTKEEPVVALANKIGRMIEDEIRFTKFQKEHDGYYKAIIDDFKRKGSKDYRYMHRVLTHKANESDQVWAPWQVTERVDVGTKLLDIILLNTDLVKRVDRKFKNRNITELHPTDEALKWIKDHEHTRSFMYPERAPCIIAPDPWTGIYQGGYYTPLLRQLVPMIKTKLPKSIMMQNDYGKVMKAINAVQDVPWEVNGPVLEVVKQVWTQNLGIGMPPSQKLVPSPCPVDGIAPADMTEEQAAIFQEWKHEASAVYTAERERVSKMFQISRIVRMANDYSAYDRFWYVWYADFRGRLYTATSGFSPQGPDVAKGLLRFSRAVPLGERGWYWLRVHGANRYGYDKVSYEDRVAWVDERHDLLLATADDPMSHRELWANADKPYQFLAFVFEYAAAVRSGDPHGFPSKLSVGLDGSCNGLQNFSAMLRDPVGGRATNLVSGAVPSDIYAQVADVCAKHVSNAVEAGRKVLDDHTVSGKERDEAVKAVDIGSRWLQFGLTRKIAKRPVMTLPYGATRQSCTAYIFQEILAKDREFFGKGRSFGAASWLTPFMWKAIGEVVVAAVDAMAWLQSCAGAMNKLDAPLLWTTPDGFKVWQKTLEIETTQIDTQLAGRFQVRVGSHIDKIDKHKQRSGVSPNFVHSVDATHLRMTVVKALEAGIVDFALIHDDYGTHAAHTDTLHRVLRESFVDLHAGHDLIGAFADELAGYGGLPPDLPGKGSLDVHAVLESPYFFG